MVSKIRRKCRHGESSYLCWLGLREGDALGEISGARQTSAQDLAALYFFDLDLDLDLD